LPADAIDPEHDKGNFIGRWFETGFTALRNFYARTLNIALHHRYIVLAAAFGTFALTAVLYMTIPKGFFPEEDLGQIRVNTEASEDISTSAMLALQDRVAAVIKADPNVQDVTSFTGGGNSGRMFLVLKPRDQRAKMPQVLDSLRKATKQVPGIAVYLSPVQNLQLGGRQSKSRYQYTLQSVSPGTLNDWADKYLDQLRNDPDFRDVTSDSLNKGLQASLKIDRDKANNLGVAIGDIRTALYLAFGERQVSTIYSPAASYYVILEAADADRQFDSALTKISVRNKAGQLVQLSSFASVERTIGPTAVNHQGQLQAITISFNLAPDVPLGTATAKIDKIGADMRLPASIITNYGGDAAVFQSSQGSQLILIIAALGVIYVLLGVLYESYIHPLTILAGLPSAAVGALITLRLFNLDLTMIAIIGILMLIGIVKKNAIMMIDFALHVQRNEGRPRFRPIMMTTMAALMGALPIALGLGAGAELRQPLGLAVVGGLIFSQVITLYITPVIYLFLDKYSGTGPMSDDDIAADAAEAEPEAVKAVPLKAVNIVKH
jgi:HAE1 family hydrophobic/amphiphilic exporter-1